MGKTMLFARESVKFDQELALEDSDGTPLDVSGWDLSCTLQLPGGQSEIVLGMAAQSGDQGFFIVDAETGAVRLVIAQANLAGVDDTTGNFTLFGDLIGTPPDGDALFVSDLRVNVTTAGVDFPGNSYRVTMAAIGATLIAQLQSLIDGFAAEGGGLEVAALPVAGPVTEGDLLAIEQDGTLRKITALALYEGLQNPGLAPPPKIAPSADWNGTVASGFDGAFGSTPSDPARTTAKPVLRLLQPPNQYFTDELTIGVFAAANNFGSLLVNLGLQKVVVHFEGATQDINAPTLRTFTRYDGSTYQLLGWWITLQKPVGSAGHGEVYFEAIPRDSSMQSRVMGPYQFSPQETLHDWDKTIGSSGADYTTVQAAVIAAKGAGAQNPRVTFVTSGTHDIAGDGITYSGQGYLTFDCADGVVVEFAKPSYTTDTAMQMRTRYDGMWFRGAGFTFDFAYVSEIRHEAQLTVPFAPGRSHVFEGVRITRSLAPDALIRKSLPGGGISWSVRGSPWFLECDIHNIQDPAANANLYRGCSFRNGFHDVAYGAAMVIACTIDQWTSELYLAPIPALSAQYTGAGASATLSLTGINGANNRVLTAKVDGSSVGTFTIENTEAAFNADTNYTIANVVAWLNGLPGWVASVDDDTRYAAVLTDGTTGYGAFSDVDAKSAPLQLFTAFDLHTDFYQKDGLNLVENVIVYGNWGVEIDAQFVMIGGNDSRDWLVANNALSVKDDSIDNPGGAVLLSQLSKPHSHVMVAHNSFPQQGIWLRTGSASIRGYDPDAYCLVANNAVRDTFWDIGGTDADLTVKNNHLHSGATGTGDLGEVKDGDETSLFGNFETGDFTPAGSLENTLVVPVLQYDRLGIERAATSPPGAQS